MTATDYNKITSVAVSKTFRIEEDTYPELLYCDPVTRPGDPYGCSTIMVGTSGNTTISFSNKNESTYTLPGELVPDSWGMSRMSSSQDPQSTGWATPPLGKDPMVVLEWLPWTTRSPPALRPTRMERWIAVICFPSINLSLYLFQRLMWCTGTGSFPD